MHIAPGVKSTFGPIWVKKGPKNLKKLNPSRSRIDSIKSAGKRSQKVTLITYPRHFLDTLISCRIYIPKNAILLLNPSETSVSLFFFHRYFFPVLGSRQNGKWFEHHTHGPGLGSADAYQNTAIISAGLRHGSVFTTRWRCARTGVESFSEKGRPSRWLCEAKKNKLCLSLHFWAFKHNCFITSLPVCHMLRARVDRRAHICTHNVYSRCKLSMESSIHSFTTWHMCPTWLKHGRLIRYKAWHRRYQSIYSETSRSTTVLVSLLARCVPKTHIYPGNSLYDFRLRRAMFEMSNMLQRTCTHTSQTCPCSLMHKYRHNPMQLRAD